MSDTAPNPIPTDVGLLISTGLLALAGIHPNASNTGGYVPPIGFDLIAQALRGPSPNATPVTTKLEDLGKGFDRVANAMNEANRTSRANSIDMATVGRAVANALFQVAEALNRQAAAMERQATAIEQGSWWTNRPAIKPTVPQTDDADDGDDGAAGAGTATWSEGDPEQEQDRFNRTTTKRTTRSDIDHMEVDLQGGAAEEPTTLT